LAVKVREIRGLADHGILRVAAEDRFGLSKLLSAADVQGLAERFVETSVVAKRFHLNSVSLARYLKESGRLCSKSYCRTGEGSRIFLPNDVGAQMKIPSRRMLREHAQRRIVTAWKQHWAEYRQAREIASGETNATSPSEASLNTTPLIVGEAFSQRGSQ
jgi:hypothetical protein